MFTPSLNLNAAIDFLAFVTSGLWPVIIVKGVNIRKKHIKPRKQGEEAGIIPVECSIQSSKVNVVCPKCNKATRIKIEKEGKEKVRICKKCGAKIK